MTLLTSLARVEAAAVGRAQRIRTVRHVHLSDRPLVVIPLQLAGEACAPLAVMVGDDPAKPRLLTVYEPRDRAKRFEFVADLAEVILGYLDGYVPAGGDGGQGAPGGMGARGDGGREPPTREDSPGPGDADPDDARIVSNFVNSSPTSEGGGSGSGGGSGGGGGASTGHLDPFPDAPQLIVPNPNAARFLGCSDVRPGSGGPTARTRSARPSRSSGAGSLTTPNGPRRLGRR